MSFLGEIKRRKVFQVGAIYAVVAWLAIQVITAIETPLGLPDWVDTLVIVLLAIGFPLTLVISWAFDVTPEGIVRDAGGDGPLKSRGRKIEYVLIGMLVIAVGWIGYSELGPSAADRRETQAVGCHRIRRAHLQLRRGGAAQTSVGSIVLSRWRRTVGCPRRTQGRHRAHIRR